MAIAEIRYPHIVLDVRGVAVIEEKNVKVTQLVLDRMAYGWSPEELHFQHPYLTFGEIYSALAYYWDHKQQLDEQIEQQLRSVEQWKAKIGSTSLITRLKSQGLL